MRMERGILPEQAGCGSPGAARPLNASCCGLAMSTRSPKNSEGDSSADRAAAAQQRAPRHRKRLVRPWLSILKPVALLVGCAALFVGSEVLERHLFPGMTTGWKHALLTTRAALVTAVGCTIVFLQMRGQQNRLSMTAHRLSSLLESYKTDGGPTAYFENPHLQFCRDVLDCERRDCPMFGARGERCWQVVALSGAGRGENAPEIEIQQCHDCAVFCRSCPDRLTQLGESFNNLMFLLEAEAAQVGRMRAQLVEKEKMVAIGQMASGIAHEVGNPLSSISSIVQLLKRSKNDGPETEQLDLIQRHIKRISTTVRQLVTLARPTPDGWERVDIAQLLEEAVRLIGFDDRARNIDIDFVRPESLPSTYGLRGELTQVVINLALNALDAMPEGGRLVIRAEKHRQRITVRVADTGCGIDPKIGRRVFEPFFTTKQPGLGTGLGLSVSYGIVQKHGGEIELSSVVGKGTEFVVQLPILDKPPEA